MYGRKSASGVMSGVAVLQIDGVVEVFKYAAIHLGRQIIHDSNKFAETWGQHQQLLVTKDSIHGPLGNIFRSHDGQNSVEARVSGHRHARVTDTQRTDCCEFYEGFVRIFLCQ